MVYGIGNIYVSAVLEQVINVQHICQVAPPCLTLSLYTMAANCAPDALAMSTCGALTLVGGLHRAV